MTEQLTLPYEEITSLAGRNYLRDTFKITNKVAYQIPFKDILIRPGFNKRIIYERIDELADSIFAHGLNDPFVLDVLPDGRCFIFRGHRRHKAYLLLIEQGRFDADTLVQFFPTSRDVTEMDRMADQYISNNLQMKFTPLEQSEVAFSLKHNFGQEKTNEDVAALMAISRQTVDNLIIIATAPDDVKNEVKLGNMSFTEAVSFIRSQRKVSKEADKKEKESHETQQNAFNLPEDPLKQEMEELKELDEQADQYLEKQKEKEAKDLEKLQEIANEVLATKEALTEQIGKKFALPVFHKWVEDFVDEATGETVGVDRSQLIVGKDIEVDEDTINSILAHNTGSVYIYKKHTIASSVLTHFIEDEKEAKPFDELRPEIKSIQDAIRAGDKIEAIVSKLEVPEQVKQDISYQVHWLQKNLVDSREWIHKHKQQNKIR